MQQNYEAAKGIKQGQTSMDKKLAPLASWISENYQVSIINILYGVGDINRLRWLEIWFEFSRDLDQWITQPRAMELEHGKQQAIADQLLKLQGDRSAHSIWSWSIMFSRPSSNQL